MAIKASGSGLAGAQVTVMQGSKRIAVGMTDNAGTYSLQLPIGNYSIKVDSNGFAPSGKMIAMVDRRVLLDVQLDPIGRMPDITPPISQDRLSPLDIDPFRSRRGFPDPANTPGVRYIVEYRLNVRSPWLVLATKQTQREANMALSLAIDRGQISKTAEARVRTERSQVR